MHVTEPDHAGFANSAAVPSTARSRVGLVVVATLALAILASAAALGIDDGASPRLPVVAASPALVPAGLQAGG